MNDVRGVSPGDGRPTPRGTGEEWLSFEWRMRKRRVERCLRRAEGAIEEGNPAEARAALDEARELAPESAQVDALEARLRDLEGARHARSGSVLGLLQSWRVPIAYGASSLALLTLTVAGVGFAGHFWNGDREPSIETASAVVESVVAATPPAPATHSASALRVVHETVRVREARPRLVEEMPPLPAMPGPPVADARPEQTAEPVVLAVNRRPAPPPPDTPSVRSELPAEALQAAVGVAAPPLPDAVSAGTARETTAAPPETTVARSDMPVARAEAPEPRTDPPAAPDDSVIVRDVLHEYERAYSRLDAAAASAVWPRVNRNELARAFDGLASQRVSLGSCDVAINGPAAQATCSGSATWEPKIGGGVRTEPRRWSFELRKRGAGWQIERLRVQGS